VTSIGEWCFNSNALKDIYYDGTVEEWNAIEKEGDVFQGNNVTLHCKQ